MKNWKRQIVATAAAVLLGLGLVGCGAAKSESTAASSAESSAKESSSESTAAASAAESKTDTDTALRVGALKGPTAMGLVNLMQDSQDGKSEGKYEFSIASQPDEVASKLVSGELDIALLPANMASALYNKTEGKIAVVNINTLGVLYCVSGDTNIHGVQDLAGKTVYTTGQGATPEYVLRYLLKENGVTDCNLEFKSEPTEIASLLAADATAIAVLPQPFVTVAEAKNEQLKTAFSLTDAWDVVAFGILENEGIAKKVLPACNITAITGEEMKKALSGYLNVLYEVDPKAVGGKLPDDAFYAVTVAK